MFIRARDNLLMAVSINLSVLSLYSSLFALVFVYMMNAFCHLVHAFPQSTRASFTIIFQQFSNNLTNEQLPLPSFLMVTVLSLISW